MPGSVTPPSKAVKVSVPKAQNPHSRGQTATPSHRQHQHCAVIQPLHGPPLWHCRTPVLTNAAECAKIWFAPQLFPIYLPLTLSFLHKSPSPPVLHDTHTAPTPSTARPAFPPLFCSALTHNLGPGVSVCVQILYHRTHAHLLIN